MEVEEFINQSFIIKPNLFKSNIHKIDNQLKNFLILLKHQDKVSNLDIKQNVFVRFSFASRYIWNEIRKSSMCRFYITSLHIQSHKIISSVTTDKSFSDKCSIFVWLFSQTPDDTHPAAISMVIILLRHLK